MIWDDKADGLLLALWNEGGSLGFVADGMKKAGYNVSRNSVAGRKHRLAPEQIMRALGLPMLLARSTVGGTHDALVCEAEIGLHCESQPPGQGGTNRRTIMNGNTARTSTVYRSNRKGMKR